MPRGRHAKKIQYTHWTYGSADHGALTAGTAASTVAAAQHEPETILRIRGEWVAYVDGASAPPKTMAVGVGLILVPEGEGTTVRWSPITDGDAPWLWVDYAIIGYEEMVIDVVDVPALTMVRRVIDNKAMRIVRNRELQFVVENATIGGAGAVNVFANFRVLSGT